MEIVIWVNLAIRRIAFILRLQADGKRRKIEKDLNFSRIKSVIKIFHAWKWRIDILDKNCDNFIW